MSYPPPPQGGYPQQPPQQPYPPQGGYAYPPQQQMPQQPYPQQGGYAYPPQQQQQQWGPPPQGPAPQGPNPPGGGGGGDDSIKKNLVIVVGLLVVVGLIWAAVSVLSKDDAKNAAYGDCMKNSGTASSPDLNIVDCNSSDAQYKVLAVHNNTTLSSKCEGYDLSYVESYGTRKKRKTVLLCLNELKK